MSKGASRSLRFFRTLRGRRFLARGTPSTLEYTAHQVSGRVYRDIIRSGFIMSLDMFLPSVRVISWLLPTTYGTLLLRDIALRGTDPN
jgi:hypothetical protein